MNIDLNSLLLGGVGVWLLGWIGKHTLDWLLWPRIVDWFARGNKTLARRRAMELSLTLEDEFLHSPPDIRRFILRSQYRQTVLIVRTIALASGVTIFAVILHLTSFGPILTWFMLAILGVGWICLSGIPLMLDLSYRQERRKLTDPENNYADKIARITRLLNVAGLGTEEKEEWLSQLTPKDAAFIGKKPE